MCRRQEWGTVCLEAAVHSATADVINSSYRLDVITPAWCPAVRGPASCCRPFLGRIAGTLCYFYACRNVASSVRLSVATRVSCAKTDEPVGSRFGRKGQTHVDPKNRGIGWAWVPPLEWALLRETCAGPSGVLGGIRRIPTSGGFLTAYTHLSDDK